MKSIRKIPTRDLLIYLLARLQKKLRLVAVRGSQVHPTSKIESGSQIVNTTIDRNSFCGNDCVIVNADVGSFCSIADQVIIGGSEHPIEFVSTSPVFLSHRDSVRIKYAKHDYEKAPRTTIGNDVWIGRNAMLKSGVSIGHGSVIGMGAVVTKSFPEYSIVAGNPARLIRARFTEEIIERLLDLQWWNWSDTELRDHGQLFNDPEYFIKETLEKWRPN